MSFQNINKHYVISGVGRSGTTFLIRLLTELGLETGFQVDSLDLLVDPVSKAGLEFDLRKPGCPYIVKSPWLCCYVDEVLSNSSIVIEHVLIPIRNLYSAAESRRRVSRESVTAGGLWLTESYKEGEQESVLGKNLYNLLYSLVEHNIPFTFVTFPRLALDVNYLYASLDSLVTEVPFDTFRDVFERVRKPGWIGNFER